MPHTEVHLFREESGKIPVLGWLEELEQLDPKAHAKCVELILRLGNLGHELRRPHADILRNGVHELRCSSGNVQYRILYGFIGRNVALLSHGTSKKGKMRQNHIDKAVEHLRLAKADPEIYTATFDT